MAGTCAYARTAFCEAGIIRVEQLKVKVEIGSVTTQAESGTCMQQCGLQVHVSCMLFAEYGGATQCPWRPPATPNPLKPTPPVSVQSPEQLKAAQAAVQAANQAASKAARVASLAGMAGHYRDILVSMEAVYAVQVNKANPLLPGTHVPSKPKAPQAAALSSPTFPVMDVTNLPDNHASVPQGELAFDGRYMDKMSCWMQTKPNHVETSTQLQAGIDLFPPQEAAYPTYVDFQNAMRLLDFHKSRKRMGTLRVMRKRQDRYQMKNWDHRAGAL